jgi:hypothetical protein
VAALLGSPRSGTQFQSIRWSDIVFAIDKPRFGVEEVLDSTNPPVLLVANALQDAPKYLLGWVLWREAVLGFLCRPVRLVAEAADLGLYAGLKYGVKNPTNCEYLQRIWETISPPQFYENYSYAPTSGFELFDKAVDNHFLRLVVAWLNSAFSDTQVPLTTRTFTSALERWIFEFHNPLN